MNAWLLLIWLISIWQTMSHPHDNGDKNNTNDASNQISHTHSNTNGSMTRNSFAKQAIESSKKEIVLMDYQQYQEMQHVDDQQDTDYDINGFSRCVANLFCFIFPVFWIVYSLCCVYFCAILMYTCICAKCGPATKTKIANVHVMLSLSGLVTVELLRQEINTQKVN